VARDTALFSIGLLPFILIATAFISMASILLFTNLTTTDIVEILVAMGAIWLTVIAAMFFVSRVCGRISPREAFVDVSANPNELFMKSFAETEKEICKLVKKGDEFIRSDKGVEGDDNPSLVFDAMRDARNNIDMVTCPPPTLTADPNMLEKRLKAMEETVAQFTDVLFKKAFTNITTSSECFKDAGISPEEDEEDPFIEWTTRLKAVQDAIKSQKTQYLDPLEMKQKELQSGAASDCQMQKGAENAVSLKSTSES